jgi:hypothetical protein
LLAELQQQSVGMKSTLGEGLDQIGAAAGFSAAAAFQDRGDGLDANDFLEKSAVRSAQVWKLQGLTEDEISIALDALISAFRGHLKAEGS